MHGTARRFSWADLILPKGISPMMLMGDNRQVSRWVSEETGIVSYVENGRILRRMEADTLRTKLREVLSGGSNEPPEPESKLREGSTV